MSLLSLFKKKLTPKWTFKKEGFIWKALFLPTGLMVIEHRGKSEKRTAFFMLDVSTGKPIWSDFTLLIPNGPKAGEPVGEGWWVGLEAVRDELFYLHSYFNPNSPEHLGIWALEAHTKELKWALPDFSFVCFTDQKLMAYRDIPDSEGFADRTYFLIHPRTGEIVESLGSDSLITNRLRDQSEEASAMQGVELPVACPPDAVQYEEIRDVLKPFIGNKTLIGPIELLRAKGKLLFGYHEQSDRTVVTESGVPIRSLTYRLKVLDESSQKIILDDILGSLMSGLMVDGFFIQNDILYYVKDRDTLIAYDLT